MRPGSSSSRRLLLAAGLCLVARALVAQCPADSTRRVPQATFAAGGMHRLFFGAHYRDLWADTVTVPVLHLACEFGGLRVVRQGGGKQTRSLRLVAADGRQFSFRSLDKDPGRLLPEELRGSVADRVLHDQISAALPGGPLVAARLARTAGVPQLEPRLMAMGDDPALGEFRKEFAGMLGFLEFTADDAPDADIGDGKDPIGTDKLYKRLASHPKEAVDGPAFATARLFDVYIGDWDRHRDQWRWVPVSTPAGRRWEPVPRDRDQAFVKFDGVILGIARSTNPQLIKFGSKYPYLPGATWNGRDLDRRFLSGVPRAAWDSAAADLRRRLTDGAIDTAVAAMVPTNAKSAATLRAALRARRDALPAMALGYYRQLAAKVDVHTTDERDEATVTWNTDGSLDVHVEHDGAATFDRRFVPDETSEVRLYLHGGRDRVRLVGTGPGRIGVRIVPGSGSDRIVDSIAAGGGGHATVYDVESRDTIARSGHLATSSRPFVPPHGWDSLSPPPRDWGSWTVPSTQLGYQTDIGLFIGGGRTRYFYGFRQFPYRAKVWLNAGYAFGAMRPRIELGAELPEIAWRVRPVVVARVSGIDLVRFYGFGNETVRAQPDSFFRARQNSYELDFLIERRFGRRSRIAIGPFATYSTSGDTTGRILGAQPVYGVGDFGRAGAQLLADFDGRDVPGAPRHGGRLRVSGRFVPKIWDVIETFGSVQGDASTYLTPGRGTGGPTLALRAGGKKVWGAYPYMEAAYVGGGATLRGFNEQRFAGDAAVWGSAELRQPVGTITLVLPARLGLIALGDAGRVFLAGESSDKWHTAWGGGLSLGYLEGKATGSVVVARSPERTGVYIRGGFAF